MKHVVLPAPLGPMRAEGGMHDPPQQDRRGHEERVHEVVEGEVAAEVDAAEREPLEPGEAVLASGPGVENEDKEPEHHAEGDREQ